MVAELEEVAELVLFKVQVLLVDQVVLVLSILVDPVQHLMEKLIEVAVVVADTLAVVLLEHLVLVDQA
jgi:hypothetical protein|tara:strand:+ start:286 stop:489 length:204 start_codon:yes stop_codon:yes gene_type:complete